MTEKNFQADLEFAKSKLPPTVDWVRLNVGPTFLEFHGGGWCSKLLVNLFGMTLHQLQLVQLSRVRESSNTEITYISRCSDNPI